MKFGNFSSYHTAQAIFFCLANFILAGAIMFQFEIRPAYLSNAEGVLTLALFMLVGVYSIIMYSKSSAEGGISTNSLFWFFSFWFFFIVPLTQFISGEFDFAPIAGPRSLYVLMVFIWLVSFQLSRSLAPDLSYWVGYRNANGTTRDLCWGCLTILATLLAVWVIVYAARYSFLFLAIRLPDSSLIQGTKSLYLITNFFIRPGVAVAFFIGLAYLLHSEQKTKIYCKISVAYLFILYLLTNFPTSQPRFYFFATIVVFIMIISPKVAKNGIFTNLFLLVAILGSSILHLFRGVRSEYDLEGRFGLAFLHEGHFSSFNNFTHVVNYVNEHGIQWGEQLMGSILFWVPRVFWEDKPIGTAEFVVKDYLGWEYGVTFTNISMPAVGEFYIDFHMPGILAGAIIFGVLSSNIDRMYSIASASGHRQIRPILVTSFLTGLWLFIQRGDFQSAVAYTAGIVLSIIVVTGLATRKAKRLEQ